MRTKVLIGGPVRQDAAILKCYLQSLANLAQGKLDIDYYFVDDNVNDNINDNTDSPSSILLDNFSGLVRGSVMVDKALEHGTSGKREQQANNEITHYWNDEKVWRVAAFKNKIIDYCLREKYDYLFLVDSDLVLHPETLLRLLAAGKDIISEIFWTKWQPDSPELPQVWLYDQYSMGDSADFLQHLREPGVYEVGGLGACTLISNKALMAGVNFNRISNISFWGEDRHFCIRAAALGFRLYVDTFYPAYHIYRKSDLANVPAHAAPGGTPGTPGTSGTSATESRMKQVIAEFIQEYFACDYRIVTGYEYHRHLSSSLIGRFSERQDDIINYYRQNKTRCSASVQEIAIQKADEQRIEAEVSFTINTENPDLKKSYTCRLIMKKQHPLWVADYISLKNDSGQSLLGFCLSDLLEGKFRIDKAKDQKVTLMMLVRNEEQKFLSEVLQHAASYIDNAIILDDASTDNTVAVCEKALQNIPHVIVSNAVPGFHNEINLRKQLWEMTIHTNPDWIICLDADEIFEDRMIDIIRPLINQSEFDYYSFRLYDMWNQSSYREDRYWQAHKFYRPFLLRYQPHFTWLWQETPQHCGRFPKNISQLEGCRCHLRLRHYGWATESLRREKYKRYMELDQHGQYGVLNQYRSILDPRPNLVAWEI